MAGADRYAFAVQVDYGTMVSVYAGADIAAFDTAKKAMVVSAKLLLLMESVLLLHTQTMITETSLVRVLSLVRCC